MNSFTFTFTFTTREEYFVYKADWKNRYLETILNIRRTALKLRDACQAFTAANPQRLKFWELYSRDQHYNKAYKCVQSSQLEHHVLKSEASKLLLERQASKEEAGRQRELRLSGLR